MRAGRLTTFPNAPVTSTDEVPKAPLRTFASSRSSEAPSQSVSSSAAPSASAPPVTTDNSVNKAPPSPPPAPLMPWVAQVLEAQQAIATGDLKSAGELLKRAHGASGNGLPRTMLEHLAVATANNADPKSTCRVTGLARPRSYDLVSSQIKPVNAGRPVIALGPRGPVMSWTDAHVDAYAAAIAPLLFKPTDRKSVV